MTIGQLIYDLGNNQLDIPRLRELLENILPTQATFDDFIVEHDFSGIGKRIMILNARQIQQSSGKRKTILLAMEDITERREVEKNMDVILKEKDIILREVHHRIKNSMNTIKSLLGLQAAMITDPAAIEALQDTESRVLTMMLLYDKLYRSSSFIQIPIKDYLDVLIDEIIRNFPNNGIIKVEKKIEDIVFDAKKLQSIGIIINELLTNCMKYAFIGRPDGTIRVIVASAEDTISISIQDNGNGIPEDIDFDNSTGFGLMLGRSLSEQLGGTLRIERNAGSTTILEIKI